MRRRTRIGLRGAGAVAAVGALSALLAVPAAAETGAGWQTDLSSGQGTGVEVQDGVARFDPSTAHRLPVEDTDTSAPASTEGDRTEGAADVAPTGFLTLPPHRVAQPSDEITSTMDVQTGPGSSAVLDVRGRRSDGAWTEWVPSTSDAGPGRGVAQLPEAVREVQGRLVLTASGDDRPVVRGVTLTAGEASGTEGEADRPSTEAAPLHFSVFATREGLVGGTTANGHKIAPRDRFVALPSRRALSANGRSDYSVRVCAPNGRCAFAPVWDIGPWNTKDDYWNPSNVREQWKDLPQGVPQAQAAFRNGHNGGKDGFGRRPSNPAGIDLGDGIFYDGLGLKDNSQVNVDYLWTGNARLSKVSLEGAADIELRSAPDAGAPVVGLAVNTADVPVRCRQGSDWLQVGDKQYLPASAVAKAPAGTPSCTAAGGDDSDDATPTPSSTDD